jgi:hypothetical protein
MYEKRRSKKMVILDVDGSLSNHVRRLPLIVGEGAKKNGPNWETFYDLQYNDEPYEAAVMAARAWQDEYVVAIFTGRPEEHSDATFRWLNKHGIRVDFLFMRPDDDKRPMVELKSEWLDTVEGWGYEIAVVLEDHPGVVDAFRERGLFVMQPTNHWVEYAGEEAPNGASFTGASQDTTSDASGPYSSNQ